MYFKGIALSVIKLNFFRYGKEEEPVGRPFKYTRDEFDLAWQQYFQWVDDNPWIKNEAVKSGELAGTIIRYQPQGHIQKLVFVLFIILAKSLFQSLQIHFQSI